MMEIGEVRKIVEAALLVAGEALSVEQLERLFVEGDLDSEEPRALLREVLGEKTRRGQIFEGLLYFEEQFRKMLKFKHSFFI